MAMKREHGDKGSRICCIHATCIFNSGRNGESDNRSITELLAQMRKSEYGITVAWMRCTLSFAVIRSAVMARRGSRSASNRNPDANIELGYSKGRLGVF